MQAQRRKRAARGRVSTRLSTKKRAGVAAAPVRTGEGKRHGGQVRGGIRPLPSVQELVDAIPVPVYIKGRDGRHLAANRAWESYFGISSAAFLGKTARELFTHTPEVAAKHEAVDDELWRSPGARSYEMLAPMHDGSLRYTMNNKATLTGKGGTVVGLVGTIVDITARKRAEQHHEIGRRVTRALSTADTLGAAIPEILAALGESLDLACGACWRPAEDDNGFRCIKSWGTNNHPAVAAYLADTLHDRFLPGDAGFIRRVLGTGNAVWLEDVAADETFLRGKRAAQAGLCSAFAFPIRSGDKVLGALEFFSRERRVPDDSILDACASIGLQIGQFMARKQAEIDLRSSESRFRSLTALSSDWYWEQDSEFRLTFMSHRIGERTGLNASTYLGSRRWDQPAMNLSEDDWARHRAQLERHEPFSNFEMQRTKADGTPVWISISGEPVFDARGTFRGYRGVGSDITERKHAEAVLRAAHDELTRSNTELQQFAYVASHDLQEPLRMIGSYTQLLNKRYGSKFDQDAREFMDFIIDGATRMKQLIEDLLAYSRVGTHGKALRPVQVSAALDRALFNLRGAIETSGAAVTRDALPQVMADESQLAQMLQNLIGNAIKFRKKDVPSAIHVSARSENGAWHLSVSDNGIGIEPQYFERIFIVFQRLHARDEYAGTGIGLAICKKVVDRHGGRLWVESTPGEGSTFHFTLAPAQGEQT